MREAAAAGGGFRCWRASGRRLGGCARAQDGERSPRCLRGGGVRAGGNPNGLRGLGEGGSPPLRRERVPPAEVGEAS